MFNEGMLNTWILLHRVVKVLKKEILLSGLSTFFGDFNIFLILSKPFSLLLKQNYKVYSILLKINLFSSIQTPIP